jgi:hypothetical protein
MKHTTGQWKAVAQMPEGYSIETNEGKVIAFTQCDEDYNSENPIMRAEEMANANLIAASPTMLETIIGIRHNIESNQNEIIINGIIIPKSDILKYIDLAIDKATK